jgi:hypothetical protein
VNKNITRQYSGVMEISVCETLEGLPETGNGDMIETCVANHDKPNVIYFVSVDPFFEPYFY